MGLHVGSLFFFILSVGAGQGLPLPGPSGPASSSSWREDSFGLQVLLESFDEKGTEESSVNQPPANPVASPEEAASPPHVVPYPYQPDEVIGVCSFYPAEALSQRPLSFCRGHTTGPKTYSRSRSRFSGSCLALIQKEIGWDGEPGPSKIPAPPRERSPWRNSIPFVRISKGGESIPRPSLSFKRGYPFEGMGTNTLPHSGVDSEDY